MKREVSRTLYRQLLRHSRLLEEPRSTQATNQIKESFRANANVKNEDELDTLLQTAYTKLNFMRMLIPSHHRPTSSQFQESQSGRYVVRDGELVKGEANKVDRNLYIDKHNIDPESLERHNYLLRRQHFLEPPPPHVFEMDKY